MQMERIRHRQQTQTKQIIKDIDGMDNSSTGIAYANTDLDRADNLGTGTKGATGSNNNDNSKTIYRKFVSFSINNITVYDYFKQLIPKIMKLSKNLLELNQLEATRTIATATPTSNVRNLSVFY